MLRRLGLLAVAGAAAWIAGCRQLTGPDVVCTGEMRPAIVVEIRHSRTGAALAYGARGVVRDGAYADSLAPAASSSGDPHDLYSRRAADERPGTYAVEVVHEGYQAWSATGVSVGRDACHVRTVELRADLVPLS